MKTFFKYVTSLVLGIVCGTTVGILPLVLVNHKHLDLVLAGLNWQKVTFIFVCMISVALLYIAYSLSDNKKEKTWRADLLPLSIVFYLCLYTTCAALCEKLNFTLVDLPMPPIGTEMSRNLYSGGDYSIVSSVGLVLVVAAAVIAVYRCLRGRFADKTILCRPDWSYLVFMAGVPLVFSVWLPLFALPGAAVALKWINKGATQAIIN